MTRQPYHPPMPRAWWRGRQDHGLYMLREATVLPLLFFVGCLVYGLYALEQGEAAWLGWLVFMQRPTVLALHLLALAAALLHAATFFRLVPEVVTVRMRGIHLHPRTWVMAQWVLLVLVFLGLWWLVAGTG